MNKKTRQGMATKEKIKMYNNIKKERKYILDNHSLCFSVLFCKKTHKM